MNAPKEQLKELDKEFNHMRETMVPLMWKPGSGHIDRVSVCTMAEEFLHWNGWAFDSHDQERDCWKYLWELFDDAVSYDDNGTIIAFKKKFMERCGLTDIVLQVKYPMIYKLTRSK